MNIGQMEFNRISPGEVDLVIYERNVDSISANIGIAKKSFKAYDINVRYKTVDDNWEDELNNTVQRVVFVISSDKYISKVKRKIAYLREENNNVSAVTNIKALILHVTADDDDDDTDDEFQFESDDEGDSDIIKVDDLNNVYKWLPNILLFLREKNEPNGADVKRRYGCFFMFSENSNKESEWFKRHRDCLEKLGIQCLRKEKDSQIDDDVYMKSSKCVIMYINNNRHSGKVRDTVRKAIRNGCKIRLFLENAKTEFAEEIREECNVTLTGSTVHAHLAGLMRDLDLIDVRGRQDNKFYSRTGDNNFRQIYIQATRPVTVRGIVPVVSDVYSFEHMAVKNSLEDTNTCSCRIM